MRGVFFAAAAALVSLTNVQGQPSIEIKEDQIQAVLEGSSTTISIPVDNSLGHAVQAQLLLDWLDTDDRDLASTRKILTVNTGHNAFEIPLPIPKSNLWLRLRYLLTPGLNDVRAFTVQSGTVALSQIAGHVFEVKISHAGSARPGARLTIHGQAVHPTWRTPVQAVEWKARATVDETPLNPARITVHPQGFVDIDFDIPADIGDSEDTEANVWVQAQKGDFTAAASGEIPIINRLSARLQTDKPIYQPGQTIHMRAVILDAQDRALNDANVVLRIEDESGELVHTAHLVTSRFGVAGDDWSLPPTSDLGTYQLILTGEDDDVNQIGSHFVRVSRYELPTFRVEAKPDQTAYLPGQSAKVTINGNFLFGKPVPNGMVKVTRADGGRWNAKTRKYEGADDVLQGEAGADGIFTATLDLAPDHKELSQSDSERFRDIHFAAYYTDPASGRTEQRRFDIRITREPVHVYLIPGNGGRGFPAPVYVSTDYADGRPAAASVELRYQGRLTTLHTNQYGVGKAFLPLEQENGGEIEVQATDSSGVTGKWTERYWHSDMAGLRLETSRTVYRAGEAVAIKILATPETALRDQSILVYAIAGDQAVSRQFVRLVNGAAAVTFSYQPEFRRTVVFAAWNGAAVYAGYGFSVLGSKAVIFPDSSELHVTANTDRRIYRPGEKATLQMRVSSPDGQPVEAALGVAVVDQAVLERDQTDQDFGRRDWFGCAFCGDEGESEIGSVRLNDLYRLPPTKPVSPEMDLVAEALVARAGVPGWSEGGESIEGPPQFKSVTAQMEPLRSTLDRSPEFPTDEPSLLRILGEQWTGPGLRDPWTSRYTAKFMVERDQDVIRVMSSGPDKRAGTSDDFVAGTFYRHYFAPVQKLIEQILRQREDYPATDGELRDLLRENGLLLDSLWDRWGTPYRVTIRTQGSTRYISLLSAGPDRRFETPDDFIVSSFSGPYFRRETAAIEHALREAPQLPQTLDEFRDVLENAGIDVSQYRDAWGRDYRLTATLSSQYSDRLNSKTVRVFGEPTTSRTEVVPVTRHLITFALRSSGADGIEGTYDDFDVFRFPTVLREESAITPGDSLPQPATRLRGTGAIAGTVTDAAGGVVPQAKVILIDAAGVEYETTSAADGVYRFASVPAGLFSLRVSVPGFRLYEVSRVPVTPDKTATVDVTLQVGSVAESVTVEATGSPLQTAAAAIASSKSTSTPRVRDYFPETLLWIPELVTDRSGAAQTRFPLADSVTTWKIAVIASTVDGRIAEVDKDLPAFQPFFLDFNPPPVLTEGDRLELPVAVRNYTKTARRVTVNLQGNNWSAVDDSPVKEAVIRANDSANLSFRIQAKRAMDPAQQRIVAVAGRERDAIERSLRVHPDGQEITQTVGDLIANQAMFSVFVPPNAINGATRGELRLYPNVASLLLESAASILETPHGCAEQTVSGGYANLVALRYSRKLGITNPRAERVALKNVQVARDALPHFEAADGGVTYWGTGDPDVAVTAYALSFLVDSSALIDVDRDQLDSLVSWLERHQQPEGTWKPRAVRSSLEERQAVLLTALVVRSLAAAHKAGVEVSSKTFAAAYHHLARFTGQLDEPYLLAQFILAALDSGDESLAGNAITRLAGMARDERGGLYWDLQTNSPFYGWGITGRVETTSVAISALSAWRARHPKSTELDPVIRRGVLSLLRQRDSYGNWFSTQSTLRAMQAMADASPILGKIGSDGRIAVRVNGRLVETIAMPKNPRTTDPVFLDMSSYLSGGDNRIEFTSSPGAAIALMRFSETHWLPWAEAPGRKSAELRLAVAFDHLEGRARQPVRCSVKAERVGFRGYGMMLAEIGLPPGAEVDRASLESLVDDPSVAIYRYDVLPDRVILYLWPNAGGTSFDFYLNIRDPLLAKSAPSRLYDYYNPEALSEVPPFSWAMK